MCINKTDILISQELSVSVFLSLRRQVDFQPLSITQAENILKNTTYITAAYDGSKCIGLTRLLFDYGTDAYITDVIVHPEYQGYGIGKMLIKDVLLFIKEKSSPHTIVTCSLYANKGKEMFYEKLGFSRLPNEKYGGGMAIDL